MHKVHNQDVGNDEFIIMSNFSERILIGYKVIEPPPAVGRL